ncbi:hypothetical protein ACVDG8_001730 [Mesorhizobium sp. ORM8.1]
MIQASHLRQLLKSIDGMWQLSPADEREREEIQADLTKVEEELENLLAGGDPLQRELLERQE